MGSASATDTQPTSPASYFHRVFNCWRTGKSTMGLYREYLYKPSYVPDLTGVSSVPAPCTPPPPTIPSTNPSINHSTPAPPSPTTDSDCEAPLRGKLGPLPNFTSFLQARWLFCKSSSTASYGHAQEGVNAMNDERFGGWKKEDARKINFANLG